MDSLYLNQGDMQVPATLGTLVVAAEDPVPETSHIRTSFERTCRCFDTVLLESGILDAQDDDLTHDLFTDPIYSRHAGVHLVSRLKPLA